MVQRYQYYEGVGQISRKKSYVTLEWPLKHERELCETIERWCLTSRRSLTSSACLSFSCSLACLLCSVICCLNFAMVSFSDSFSISAAGKTQITMLQFVIIIIIIIMHLLRAIHPG